ncbi:M20/M25/M40 family metallo-hydrolase [Kitasatospora sp. NBC_01266]|uniref:M20/M25/M40 family metallo-hydrolase n=1 Tax=Kitasatospora sp. NBC_01266 TaxID=2903572 RepID=UPI002E33FB81|nr:M20/M25/M40 family metallo-hydrolase [Kitasatospora sp. NBC_01266]
MIKKDDRSAELRRRTDRMVEHLGTLVRAETPSEDLAACADGAQVVSQLGKELLGEPAEFVESGGRTHLRWRWPARPGGATVALIGHFDTVWPLGTLERWPFAVDEAAGTATGPGCFDMKAGIVQLFHAVSVLADRSGVEILLTCDEEIGSQTSRHLIEETARRASAALILEASGHGALKTGRKGTGMYRLEVTGRAAHAGLEPEKGANALTALAHLLLAVDALARPDLGSTITPTLSAAGTANNTVPAHAYAELDVRVSSHAEADRIDAALKALTTVVPGTSLTVTGGPHRPPLTVESSTALFERARAQAESLGLGRLQSITVGGASDGNFTAAVGCPTLDGLGAVGDGAHAEGEYVSIAALPQRAALLAHLVEELLAGAARVG